MEALPSELWDLILSFLDRPVLRSPHPPPSACCLRELRLWGGGCAE
jgi:hypothetical protein